MCCEYPNFLSLLYRALAKYAQNITIPTHMPRCVIENQTARLVHQHWPPTSKLRLAPCPDPACTGPISLSPVTYLENNFFDITSL